MALNKEKILSDLGNVMNQLQSADCGCMGKLFNQQQGQCMGSPGYGGCCRRGYGHPCCGEPYTIGEGMPTQGRPYMGYCNPPKLYADGYNFLNQTVMQPVIKEVYEDLKSLNSANTVTNNPLGAKMGLTPGVPTIPGEGQGNMNPNAQMGNMNQGGQHMARGHPMMQHMVEAQYMSGGQEMAGGQQMTGGQQMASGQQMSGGQNMAGNASGLANFNKMFPGIVKGEGGALGFNPMEIAMQMNPSLGKQNPGKETPQNPMSTSAPNAMQSGMAASNFAPNQTGQNYQSQPNSPNQAMTNQQYANNPAAYSAHTRNQLPPNFPPQGNAMSNMAGRNPNAQMTNANQGGFGGNYGNHTAGITKFKEMFPGVMQGGEGEINFDPMEIAIQMNPANKQMAAMSTMQKLMSSKPLEPNSAAMKPVINGMNAVQANFAPNQAAPTGQAQPTAPDQMTSQPLEQQQYTTNQAPTQQQQYATNQAAPIQQQQYATNQAPPIQQQQYATNQIPANQQYAVNPTANANQPFQQQQPQQVYTAVTDSQGHPQMPQQQGNEQTYIQPQEVIATPEAPMSQGYPNQVPPGMVYQPKEPIYPVDNSRYNTLGQPIELVQAKNYHMPVPNLPQTLSPQPVPSRLRLTNQVKSTISRTSLFAKQTGQGRVPSRAQLQQVYNQYKGSQSYTNQNIQNIRDPAQGHTASDGRLNTASVPPKQHQVPVIVERVGGDTAANNQPAAYHESVKGGDGHDVVTNKPPSSPDTMQTPAMAARLRNGLQDIVYTSYPKSAAWSFHGIGESNVCQPVRRPIRV